VNETHEFTRGLISGLTLTTELLNVVGIAMLLVWIEPMGSIAIVVLVGAAGVGYYRLARSRLLQWGRARQYHEGMRIQQLQQGLGGVKEVKLLGREAEFLRQYAVHNVGAATMQARQDTLQQLPRIWLELLAVITLATVVLASIAQGRPIETLIPTLGLFAAAAFRLIPSANRILGTVQNVRYTLPVINTLYAELKSFQGAQLSECAELSRFRQGLALESICYSYPAAEKPTLHNINLTVKCGAAVGFIGGSGAGKSTLVDLILGLLTPTSGMVRVDGIDIQTNLRAWQNQIGYVPQSIFLTDDTLRRNVAFGVTESQIDEASVWQAICAAQLEEFVSELPQGLDTVVGERGVRISGGQRQRIGIARALYRDPTVLVLDEATSSLDIATESGVVDAVRALHGKKTILIVAHRPSTIAHCDHVYRLEQGRVIEEISRHRTRCPLHEKKSISAVQTS
jgi:ABC-type multidrug transport system fused ATPase/permease subunit